MPWFVRSKCWYCGGPGETRDHIFPKGRNLIKLRSAMGRRHMVAACLFCNTLKGSMLPEEFREYLKRYAVTGRKRQKIQIKRIQENGFRFWGEIFGEELPKLGELEGGVHQG